MSTTDFLILPVQPGCVAQNNMHDKMFKDGLSRHLVNETSQNSVDAANLNCEGRRAKVTFTLKNIARAAIEPYGLRTAELHAEACTESHIGGIIPGDVIPILTYEDESGGLAGMVTKFANNHRTPLGRFMFAVGTGVDGKNGKSNGRHGMGSHTGAAVSSIRCMHVYSRRLDGTSIASARLSLPTHEIGEEQFASDARLGLIADDGQWNGILLNEQADAMANAFGFKRPADIAGLSCAIIDPDQSVTYNSLVEQIISDQFYQISKGLIEFSVSDESTDESITISAENFEELFTSGFVAGLKDTIRSKRGRRLLYDPLDRAHDALHFISTEPNPDDVAILESFDTVSISANVRVDWLSGKPVGYRVPVTAEHETKGTVSGAIMIWMKKLADGQQGCLITVRDAIVNIRKTIGYMALSISANDDISVMLGDSEDPPHINYTKQQARSRGWTDVSQGLNTFLGGAEALQRALAASDTKIDRISLARFFPMPGKLLDGQNDGGAETDDGSEGDVLVTSDKATNSILEVRMGKEDGKNILEARLTPAGRKECLLNGPFSLSFELEYEKSKKGDGTFADTGGSLYVDGNDAHYTAEGRNKIIVHDVDAELRIVARNIDRNRDLAIKLSRIEADTDEAAEFEDAA